MAVAALLVYFIHPFFTWFVADDFCFMPEVQSQGVFQNMWHHYMTWDGRGMSLTFIIARVGLWTGVYWVGPMLASLLLLLFGLMNLRLFLPEITNRNERIITLSAMAAVLWLCCFPFASQTLYWSTGAGYNLDIILILAGYAGMMHLQPGVKNTVLGIPLFFYVGTASPNAVAGLLLIMGIQAIYETKQGQGRTCLRFTRFVLPMLAGFLMVILAPGNANRLVGLDRANLTHIWTIYFNIKHIFSNLMEYNTPVIWALMAVGLLGGIRISREEKQSPSRWLQIVHAHRFLLAACVSAWFFAAMPGAHAPRTNIHFMAFMVMYGISGLGILHRNRGELVTLSKAPVLNLILMVFLVIGSTQAFDARNTRKLVLKRDAKLRALKGQDVVLGKEDDIKEPESRTFEDVGENPNYWLNQCVANHYGLKSIKMIKKTIADKE